MTSESKSSGAAGADTPGKEIERWNGDVAYRWSLFRGKMFQTTTFSRKGEPQFSPLKTGAFFLRVITEASPEYSLPESTYLSWPDDPPLSSYTRVPATAPPRPCIARLIVFLWSGRVINDSGFLEGRARRHEGSMRAAGALVQGADSRCHAPSTPSPRAGGPKSPAAPRSKHHRLPRSRTASARKRARRV